MESRQAATAGKFLLKLLHALLAGYWAWACFEGPFVSTSGSEDVWSLGYKAGAGVCSVWFVVAICLFFKNRWPWYLRAAAIVKTLLKVLNVTYAAFCLGNLLWAFYSDPHGSREDVREHAWFNLLLLLALVGWFVCGIGLFFKKRWAWWGSIVVTLIPIAAYVAILVWFPPDGLAVGIAIGIMAQSGIFDWLLIGFFIPWTMILSFLLATRADYQSKAMPPISQPETVSQPT